MHSRLPVVLLASLAVTGGLRAQAPAIKWGPAPAVFPAGTKLAVLQGDPGQSGMFTVRLDFPAGLRLAPHFHPTDEVVTVITGTFLVGMGDTLDPAKTMALPTGAFIVAPANGHHYAIARGHTIVQVTAMGPFALTYVNPKDEPKPAAGR